MRRILHAVQSFLAPKHIRVHVQRSYSLSRVITGPLEQERDEWMKTSVLACFEAPFREEDYNSNPSTMISN